MSGFGDYFKKAFEKATFDKTKIGIIKEILGNNKYSVSLQGQLYTVPCSTDQVFEIGEKVLVLFVQNDFDRKYIIGRG